MFFDNPEFDKPLRPGGKPGRYPDAPPPKKAQYSGSFGPIQFYDLETAGLAIVVDTRSRKATVLPVTEARSLYEWKMR
jgi:hypothetical protein